MVFGNVLLIKVHDGIIFCNHRDTEYKKNFETIDKTPLEVVDNFKVFRSCAF